MDSDDSDSELDIEGSATPDTNSMHGSFEGEPQPQTRKSSSDNNNKSLDAGHDGVPEFVVRKPIPDSLHSFLGHIQQQQQLQQQADSFLAKNWLKSEAGAGANGAALAGLGSAAAGGLAALGGLGGLGGAGLAGGLGGPPGNGLPNFFIPFSAAAAAAQLPFPNFLSQAAMFHVKDSV
jgi:hypothetical protein